MTNDLTKVTAVPTSFPFKGKKYGPFHATTEKPYTEVPAALQVAANLPVYVEAAKAAATSTGGTDNPAPQLRTGDLPGNFVGIGKLKEGGVTTFEQLREKDKAALVALGLTDEQADSALAKANDPLGPARTVS